MKRPLLAGRVFRLLLALFPGWFRKQYGTEMASTFDGLYERTWRTMGRLAAMRFAIRALMEVPGAVFQARRSRGTSAPPADSHRRGLRDDLVYALRSLARTPGWTGAALFILMLGIGGTLSVFSVLHAVLLRPLPYESPERLASLWTVNRVQDLRDGSSYENGRDWLERSRSLEDVAFVLRPEFTGATVTNFGEPERLHVGLVTANFFEILGVGALAGRVFGKGDLETDARVAVIGESLWTSRYAQAGDAVGQSLTIDGQEVRIVGVVPEELSIPLRETRIWRLFDVRTPAGRNWRGSDAFWVIGLLGNDVTTQMAQSELDGVAADLELEYPETNRNRGVRVRSLRSEIVGNRVPVLLWTLFGSMTLVLLVGGTNVAQLMLSRTIERRREMAVRASLGATRARINRQLLLESAMISICAGLGGVLLAPPGVRGLLELVPPGIPLVDQVRIDGTVLGIALVVTAVVAPLVGLLPALAASRTNAAEVLRSGGRSATGGERRARSILVVAEVAMAVVLLAASGLLLRSAVELQAVDPGFDAQSTLLARVDLSSGDTDVALERPQALLGEVGAVPGVARAAIISRFLIDRIPDQTINVVGGTPWDPAQPRPRLTTDAVFPGFFEGLGVPLLHGRAFDLPDVTDGNPQSVVVNRSWVNTFAEGRDPVGLQFRWGDQVEGDLITVVGVVPDLRRTTLDEPPYPQIFMAGAGPSFDLLVRSEGDPLDVASRVRTAVRSVDPLAAVSAVDNAWDRYGDGMASRRFQTLMFTLFAGLATLLAATGLFSVLHQAVVARRREIGIRLALGASPRVVRRMVLGSGLGLAGKGLGIGMVVTLLLSGLLDRLVFGIRSTDPMTLVAVTLSLLAVAVAASTLPAVRATRVPPAETLSGE